MMFLNYGVGMEDALDSTVMNTGNTQRIELTNAVYDEVYMDGDTAREQTTDIPDWNYSTILDAKFNGDLLAGNIDFTLSSISAMLIKKRKQGEYKWTTIANIPVTNEDDLNFAYNDITSASGTTYEYAAVPVINGAEGTYQIISVESYFDGAFILDSTYGYQIYLNFARPSLTRALPSSVVATAKNKYPYTFYTSEANYDAITLSGTFIELDRQTGELKLNDAWLYRKHLRDFLSNRQPKIAKIYDGQIWMCAVVDNISESANGYIENVDTTINLVEVGDVNDNQDLYYHGFIDFLEVHV